MKLANNDIIKEERKKLAKKIILNILLTFILLFLIIFLINLFMVIPQREVLYGEIF